MSDSDAQRTAEGQLPNSSSSILSTHPKLPQVTDQSLLEQQPQPQDTSTEDVLDYSRSDLRSVPRRPRRRFAKVLSRIFVLLLIGGWIFIAYLAVMNMSRKENNSVSVSSDRSIRRLWKDGVRLHKKWRRRKLNREGRATVNVASRVDPELELLKRSHTAQDYHKQALLAEIAERLPNITKTLIVEDYRGTLFRLEWLSEDFMWAISVGMDDLAVPKLGSLDITEHQNNNTPGHAYYAYPRNSSQHSMIAFADSCSLIRRNDNNSFPHTSDADPLDNEEEEDAGQSQRIFKSARLIASADGRLIYIDCTGELVPLSLTVEDILSKSPLKSPLFPNLVLVGSQSKDLRTLQYATGEIINSRCNEQSSADSTTGDVSHKCPNTCSLPRREGLFLDSGIQLEMAEVVTQIFAVNTATRQRAWGLKISQIAPVAVAGTTSEACALDVNTNEVQNGADLQWGGRRSEVKIWDPVDAQGQTCDASEFSRVIFDATSLEDNVLQIDICSIYEYIHSQYTAATMPSSTSSQMSSYWLSICSDPPARMRLQTRHVFPSPLLQVFSLRHMGPYDPTTAEFWRSGTSRRGYSSIGSSSLTLTQPLVNHKIDVPFDFKNSLRNHLYFCVFETPTDAEGRKNPFPQRLPVYKSPSVTLKRETVEESLLPERMSKDESAAAADISTSRHVAFDKLKDLLIESSLKESPKSMSLSDKISPDWAKANDMKLLSGVLYTLPDAATEQNSRNNNLLFVLSPARRSMKFQLLSLVVPALCLVGLGWYAHGRLTARPPSSFKRTGTTQSSSTRKDLNNTASEGGTSSSGSVPSRIYRRMLRRKSRSNEVASSAQTYSPENNRSLRALKSTMTQFMFGIGNGGESPDERDFYDEDMNEQLVAADGDTMDAKWWVVRRRMLNDMGRGVARNFRSVVFRKSSSDGALSKFVGENSLVSSNAVSPPEAIERKGANKEWFDGKKYTKSSSSMTRNDSTTATPRDVQAGGGGMCSREGITNTSGGHSSDESPISTAKKMPTMGVAGTAVNTNNNHLYDSSGCLIESNVPAGSLLSELLENGRSLRTFDRWQLIGKGGFGSVFKVRHRLEPDQTCYALKLVEFQACTDGAIKYGRNFREVSTNRDVSSKYVVRYFTWWCEEPQFLPTCAHIGSVQAPAAAPAVELPKPVPPLCSRPVCGKESVKSVESSEFAALAFNSRRALDSRLSENKLDGRADWTSSPTSHDKLVSLRKAEGFSKPLRAHLAALAEEFEGRLKASERNANPSPFEQTPPPETSQRLIRTKRKYNHVHSFPLEPTTAGAQSQSWKKSLKGARHNRMEDASSSQTSSSSSDSSVESSFNSVFSPEGGQPVGRSSYGDINMSSDESDDDGIAFADSSTVRSSSDSPPKLELERTRRKRCTPEFTLNEVMRAPSAQELRICDAAPPEKTQDRPENKHLMELRVCKITLVIQMEWCNGMTLRQWLEKPERDKSCLLCLDSGEERLELVFFKQIMKGIRDIHNQGIVHRDLKPENIFVQKNSIKIGDFGLSKLVERHQQQYSEHEESSETAPGRQTSLDAMVALQRNFSLTSLAGVMIGTPSYAAPEGGVNCSEKADIYSAALILLELLSHGMKTSHERQKLLSNFRNQTSYPEYFQDGNFDGWKLLLQCMSHVDPKRRPSAETILSLIKTCNYEVSSTKYQLDATALRIKLTEHQNEMGDSIKLI